MMSRGRWSPMTFREYDARKEARMSSTKSLWLSRPKAAAAGTVRKRRRTNPENMAALAKQEMQKLIHEQGPRDENISREKTLKDSCLACNNNLASSAAQLHLQVRIVWWDDDVGS